MFCDIKIVQIFFYFYKKKSRNLSYSCAPLVYFRVYSDFDLFDNREVLLW